MKLRHIIIGLTLCMLCACERYERFDNKVYFSNTESSTVKRMSVDIAPLSYPVSVSTAEKVEAPVVVNIDFAPELVEAYNAEHQTIYQPLPAGCYELSGKTLEIGEGMAASMPVNFVVTSIADFEEGTVYMMPLLITKSEGLETLGSCSVIYLIVNRTIITPAVKLWSGASPSTSHSNNYFMEATGFFENPDLSEIKAFTYETRIKAGRFRNTKTEAPKSTSIMGIEEHCLLRFGDATIDGDQIQLANSPVGPLTASRHLSVDKWYHIALTYDGKTTCIYIDGRLEASLDAPGKVLDFSKKSSKASNAHGWCFGYAADNARYSWAEFSEARVWRVARTQAQIVNNMCYIDPNTEGLIAYWRMNEGAGKDIKDYSPNGFDMVTQRYTGNTSGTPADAPWSLGVRCEP